MQGSLLNAAPRAEDIRTAFARAARLALAGLLAAPVFLGLASAAGLPVRAAANPAFWIGALAGFGGAGWRAGRRLGLQPWRTAALAGAFLAAGVLLAAAVRGLQGLTGRESVLAVSAATLPAFSLAFGLVGILSARILGTGTLGFRGAAACVAAGLTGGAFAMLPFCWAWLGLDLPGGSYASVAIGVVGFLGSLIVPFHLSGHALDLARERKGTPGHGRAA